MAINTDLRADDPWTKFALYMGLLFILTPPKHTHRAFPTSMCCLRHAQLMMNSKHGVGSAVPAHTVETVLWLRRMVYQGCNRPQSFLGSIKLGVLEGEFWIPKPWGKSNLFLGKHTGTKLTQISPIPLSFACPRHRPSQIS